MMMLLSSSASLGNSSSLRFSSSADRVSLFFAQLLLYHIGERRVLLVLQSLLLLGDLGLQRAVALPGLDKRGSALYSRA